MKKISEEMRKYWIVKVRAILGPSATKEMCRRMANPKEADLLKVKRMCRFLRGLPRMVQKIPFSDHRHH